MVEILAYFTDLPALGSMFCNFCKGPLLGDLSTHILKHGSDGVYVDAVAYWNKLGQKTFYWKTI